MSSAASSNTIKVIVQRSPRTSGDDVYSDTFQVPLQKSQTVLDVVSWIQQNTDPTLSYRFACRVGMCGSCAMMVNGVPRWTCRTHVSKVVTNNAIEIAPLRNLPVIKDLVVDMDRFFDHWVAAEGVHHASLTRNAPIAAIDEKTDARSKANAGIECINCGVCYSACDTVAANADYLGPAALQRAWTLVNDTRDAGHTKILDAVAGSGGCHNCHAMGSCTVYCPNELDPMSAIAGLKRATLKRWFAKG
jgi:fumarate reductase iron-sulfur subunit